MLKKKIELIANMINEKMSNADILSIINIEENIVSAIRFLLSSEEKTLEEILECCKLPFSLNNNCVFLRLKNTQEEAKAAIERVKKEMGCSEELALIKVMYDNGTVFETIEEITEYLLVVNKNFAFSSGYGKMFDAIFKNEELCTRYMPEFKLVVPRPKNLYNENSLNCFIMMEKAYVFAKKQYESGCHVTETQLADELGLTVSAIYGYLRKFPQLSKYLRKKVNLSESMLESGALIAS